MATPKEDTPISNFITQLVENDLKTGKHKEVVTRFPPEPNGFLHLGHAKSICINFGLAKLHGGRCHMRFDDTNPTSEETRYIEAIMRDVKWMGGDWGEHLYYASDYFDQLYMWAEDLIQKGLAFVDDDSPEEIRRKRGNISVPGEESSFRTRSVEENLDIFRRMKNGEFNEGSRVLRAKVDMKSFNMNMRDPILYRILKTDHPRTGNKWCIYPMYDYAHGQSDSIEKITHSICTLEFDLHRALYDWFQEKLCIFRTRQIEFARLNTTYTVLSKRKLLVLVNEKYVNGWDDPRLPTLSAFRRRGVPAQAIRDFCERVGVARRESMIQIELFERCIREFLHGVAQRRFAVVKPLLIIITNWEDTEQEDVSVPNHPDDESFGSRKITFTKTLYIDQDDFQLNPSKDFHRLVLGGEVRLKYSYWLKCNDVVKDAQGNVVSLSCTIDRATKNCSVAPDKRTVKGTIHWLSTKDAVEAEFRLYARLFTKANPEEESVDMPEKTWRNYINRKSLQIFKGFVEESSTDLSVFPPQSSLQFERVGFFTPDATGDFVLGDGPVPPRTEGAPVFNMTIGLMESFTGSEDKAEEQKKKQKEKEVREKAALDRQLKKVEREARLKKKEEQKMNDTERQA